MKKTLVTLLALGSAVCYAADPSFSDRVVVEAGSTVVLPADTWIVNQRTAEDGAAVYVGDGASATLNGNTYIQNNNTDGMFGGGIFVDDQTEAMPAGSYNLVLNATAAQGDVELSQNSITPNIGNDITFGLNATARLNAEAGAAITLASGIDSTYGADDAAAMAHITKTGAGQATLRGDCNYFIGGLDVKEGMLTLSDALWSNDDMDIVSYIRVFGSAVLETNVSAGMSESPTTVYADVTVDADGALIVSGNTVLGGALTMNGGQLNMVFPDDVAQSLALLQLVGEFNIADTTEIVLTMTNLQFEEMMQSEEPVSVRLVSFMPGQAVDAFDPYLSRLSVQTETGVLDNVSVTAANGVVTLQVLPEPATATLSLLALAALCARRRRA